MESSKRILIGSPIRQEPEILKEFLLSIGELETQDITVDYYFIDDNDNANSSSILKDFCDRFQNCVTLVLGDRSGVYVRTDDTHHWKENLIWKVAGYKNNIIDHAKNKAYDYLFLIDSDIILHPKTLNQLINAEKDIISEIFWTKWHKDSIPLPQVWLYDHYDLVPKSRLERIDNAEANNRYNRFLDQLRKPGVYEVGGLGACTLVSSNALKAGVSFNEIYNISFWGEDRHFCIRAAALGFKLYVDTNCPAYHIYRNEDLDGTEAFKQKYRQNKEPVWTCKSEGNRLTLSLLVRNEGSKFLREMLSHAAQYIDNAVILDDASEDDTVEICKEILKDIPYKLVSNKEHQFSNEIVLRKQLWELTTAENPDWIVCLDADEIFEDSIKKTIKSLIDQPDFDHYAFRLYDMWDSEHYREDTYWCSHKYYRVFIIRYRPDFEYTWKETPLHCGRLPANIFKLNGCICYVRLKHYGWSTPQLRAEKYERYMSLDPTGQYGNLEQYKSILDEAPALKKWE